MEVKLKETLYSQLEMTAFNELKPVEAIDVKVSLLYTSATIIEVKQHIKKDIGAAVVQYNRVLRKNVSSLNSDPLYGLKSLDENQFLNYIKAKLDQFYIMDGVIQVAS